MNTEHWIWLPEAQFPKRQLSPYSRFMKTLIAVPHTVARFGKTYTYGQSVTKIDLRFSADCIGRVLLNGQMLAVGPTPSGGDFLDNERPRAVHYATRMTVTPADCPSIATGRLAFVGEVRLRPEFLCEYSRGHGGFMLSAQLTFADGTIDYISTGDGWDAQLLGGWIAPRTYDDSIDPTPPLPAQEIENRWHCTDAPIPPCSETRVPVKGLEHVTVPPGETIQLTADQEQIAAGYVVIDAYTTGSLTIAVRVSETIDDDGVNETCRFERNGSYRSFELVSAGCMTATATNAGSIPADFSVSLIRTCFPVAVQAHTITSDPQLNMVAESCAQTLQWCRQMLHLDSPRHCEPLACTGDYYIETLMTAFTFGDLRLAAFDIRRTAQTLRDHDGRLFHTSYSLIWVEWLYDVYMRTGDASLLTDCIDALTLLLRRFRTYLGENGLIETPPDYMFVDWLNPDGISLHHPPKALGQTCLNMFYYGALRTAEKIYAVCGLDAMAAQTHTHADALQSAVVAQLYDPERELFFEGLNTPTPPELIGQYMPQNVEKRYYRRHANILAAYVGILPPGPCRALLNRISDAEALGEVQPYFMHFWLEAVQRCGMCGQYTLSLLHQWVMPLCMNPKGLPEGFCKPEPTYRFDHSHAWGGTPAYALPQALTGLEILEPGCRRIRLTPSLMGLARADVEVPTVLGMLRVHLRDGEAPAVEAPDGMTVELRG